ncbi:MAG: hypothetical protein IKV90_05240 [Clostridia bacterium]|nr:hypothetical protein [Clostridia bacterium]
MTNFKITYEQAQKIVAAKDKSYVDDIINLIDIMNRRPIADEVTVLFGGEKWNVADLACNCYKAALIDKANECIVSDCLKRIEAGTF